MYSGNIGKVRFRVQNGNMHDYATLIDAVPNLLSRAAVAYRLLTERHGRSKPFSLLECTAE